LCNSAIINDEKVYFVHTNCVVQKFRSKSKLELAFLNEKNLANIMGLIRLEGPLEILKILNENIRMSVPLNPSQILESQLIFTQSI
jgi:transposase